MQYQLVQQPDGSYRFTHYQPFRLEQGDELPELTLVYETYGKLNAAQNNIILIHHALSSNHHLASQPHNPEPGWWENMVGPGNPIDTRRYFVISINNLGSCFGSTGPTHINPLTQKPYQADFPSVTITDMVRSQKLLLDYLGIHRLHAVIGSSMGGMLALTWSVLYPETARHLISISSCYKSYPNAIAQRTLQRAIIQLDPAWNHGFYQSSNLPGFLLARQLGLLTYRHAKELNQRFTTKEINQYLVYNAQKFVRRFDANAYLRLTEAMDRFNIARGYTDPVEPLRRIRAKTLVISVTSDVLFLPEQQAELYALLQQANVPSQFITHSSDYGHDAFLVETAAFGQYIQHFIE